MNMDRREPAEDEGVPSEIAYSMNNYAPVGRALKVIDYPELLLKKPGHLFHKINNNPEPIDFAILFGFSALFLLIYGVVVGSFLGGWQYVIAPAKIVLGLYLSAVICLPSLYIFTCIGQARIGFVSVMGNLLIALTLVGILLIGFAPVAWVFSQSTNSIAFIGFIHLAIYLVTLLFGFKLLYQGLQTVSEQQNGFIPVWIVIFLLVSLQMGTSIRPIIGRSDTFLPTSKTFFLSHWGQTISDNPQGK